MAAVSAAGISAPALRIRGYRVVSSNRGLAMTAAILDYGSGNLHSASKAFERAAREEGLADPIIVTHDPDEIRRAERVVLPGVGAFADCRRGLDAAVGMVQALNEAVRARGRPFLGICVGMQLMAERGREYELVEGLGWIAGEVDRIVPADPKLKIPHMGWNTLDEVRGHALLDGIPLGPQGLHAYFVHSFHLKPADRSDLVAQADYGGPVTAVVGRDTMVGTQFHPEKSQRLGLKLIANFLKWKP
jgi:glutamine amidotransferase